jgi:hypothetical protein
MPIWIAHRGNTEGPQRNKENHPDYIDMALKKGYHVEVDVWLMPAGLYLGHDAPTHRTTLSFMNERRDVLWCHAKNASALVFLLENGFNTFFHDIDHYTLTSKGIIWAYPGYSINNRTVCVMPERVPKHYKLDQLALCYGICTDYVEHYKNKLESRNDNMDVDI